MTYENIDILQKVNPAKLLIEDLFELYGLEKDIEKWNLLDFKDNLPRYYRLKRIDALLDSLNISHDYDMLFSGEFLKSTSGLSTEKMLKTMPELREIGDEGKLKYYEKDMNCWIYLFERLTRHIKILFSAMNINSGVMVASDFYRFAIDLTDNTNDAIFSLIQSELNIIEWLLNPNDLTYSLKELNEVYNYPLVDLIKIDIEWM